LETHGTIFYGKQAAVELIVRVLACLAEGLGIRATARVFEVDANTVLRWLVEAAEQLRAFAAYFLCDLHLEQLQLDELYAVLRALKAGEISDDEAIKRLERSPYWVWTAMDPKSKLLVVVDVGSRTLAMAQRVVHQVTQAISGKDITIGHANRLYFWFSKVPLIFEVISCSCKLQPSEFFSLPPQNSLPIYAWPPRR